MFKYLLIPILFLLSLTTFSQDNVHIEKFQNGEISSKYEAISSNYIEYQGFYKGGQLMVSGQFQNDERHGKWIKYYEDGTIEAIAIWKNGKKHGVWKRWDRNGNLIFYIVYKRDKFKEGFMVDDGNLIVKK